MDFWDSHTPENRTGNPQYRSIIFYRTEEEKNYKSEKVLKRDFENSFKHKNLIRR